MSKVMSLELLSSIKGAKSSKVINKLFEVIKDAHPSSKKRVGKYNKVVSINELRDDIVEESSKEEKQIIKKNFPKSKNGLLVVKRVVEE